MKLIFLGPPGAGKGTQAMGVAEHYGIAHISTGDMLRSEIRGGTSLGREAQAYMDKGELVPDSVIVGMVKNRIAQEDCKNGFLLDGFPRTIAQAQALEAFTDIDYVIDIDVPFERLLDRITGRRMCPDCGAAYHVSTYSDSKCGHCGGTLYQREDDKPETVEVRLRQYEKKTEPLITYYKEKGTLRRVNGDQAVEQVAGEIRRELEA